VNLSRSLKRHERQPDILARLVDLAKQATTEKSHYYVAATAIEANEEIVKLRAALRALSDMYARTWDRTDGALIMMGDGVEKFERAHELARRALGEKF
jgi:hypothetical protein